MKTIKIMSLMLLTLTTMGIKKTYSMKVGKHLLEYNEKLTIKERLFYAAKNGNRDVLKELLNSEDGAKLLNARQQPGNHTLLHIAVLNQKNEIVAELLKRKIDTSVVSFEGDTALDTAMKLEPSRQTYDKDEIIIATIQSAIHGQLCRIERMFFRIKYYKMSAQNENDHVSYVKNQLDKKDINLRFFNGWTLAHAAAHSNSPETLKALKGRGADITAKTNKNLSPLEIAVNSSSKYCIEYLLKNTKQKCADEKQKKLFCNLVKTNNITEVEKYIAEKDINFYYNDSTPLHIAIEKKLKNMFLLLIKNGANIRATDKNEDTPLHIAVKNRVHHIILKLLSMDADYNAKNLDDKKPFEIIFDKQPTIETFLNLDKPTSLIILYLAAVKENKKNNKKNNENKKLSSVDILKKASITYNGIQEVEKQRELKLYKNRLFTIIKTGNLEELKDLLKTFDVNTTLAGDNTFLHIAVKEQLIEMVIELLKRNARLGIRNKKGQTPLDIAKEMGNCKIINLIGAKKYLLEQRKKK